MAVETGRVEELLSPPQRTRLYEEVVRRLTLYIEGLRLMPGDRMPSERELAERLAVSRTSVRQAIVALEVQGVIAVRQGDGIYVRDPQRLQARFPNLAPAQPLPDLDVMDAREAIEVKLAELASLRRTDADLVVLEQTIERARRDIAAGGIGAEAAAEFHHAITAAARSRLLAHIEESLGDVFHAARMVRLDQPNRGARSIEWHLRILAAIRRGDSRAAGRAMRGHLQAVADLWVDRTDP